MKVPNRKYAYVSREKLISYLLSETHLVGRLKANFFRKVGFNEENVDELEDSLLTVINERNVKDAIKSVYGVKYVIDGLIMTPGGRSIKLRTVWIIERGQKHPVSANRIMIPN